MTAPETVAVFDVAVDELARLTEAVRGLDSGAWARPTGLGEWTVADLTAHVAGVAWRQAEALHRYRLGVAETPSDAVVASDPAALPGALDVAAAHLGAALAADFDESPNVPLPFAPLPVSIASRVIAIEYGFHRWDVERALGRDAVLRDEVAQYLVGQLPVFLLLVGTDAPDGTGYRLRSDNLDVIVVRADGQWSLGDPGPPTAQVCTIEGDDGALALFAMGRIGAEDAALTVSSADLASRFKQFFPGP
jgi:uncharacterized protein (TIGR03083 family)